MGSQPDGSDGPRLTFVYLAECTGIYGDLASLAPLHNLQALFLRGCASVYGDVASLPRNNYTKLSLSDTSAFCNSPPCTLRSPPPQTPMTGHWCGQVAAHCRTEEMVTCYMHKCTGFNSPDSLGTVSLTVIVTALAAAACALAMVVAQRTTGYRFRCRQREDEGGVELPRTRLV